MTDLVGGKLTGGKLIGDGSSTCVFKPNLPCKNRYGGSDSNGAPL